MDQDGSQDQSHPDALRNDLNFEVIMLPAESLGVQFSEFNLDQMVTAALTPAPFPLHYDPFLDDAYGPPINAGPLFPLIDPNIAEIFPPELLLGIVENTFQDVWEEMVAGRLSRPDFVVVEAIEIIMQDLLAVEADVMYDAVVVISNQLFTLGLLDNPRAPLLQVEVDELPDRTVTAADIVSEKRCSICFENFTPNETVAILPCNHIHHRECIGLWLRQRGDCPICRALARSNTGSAGLVPFGQPTGGAVALRADDFGDMNSIIPWARLILENFLLSGPQNLEDLVGGVDRA